MKKILLAALMTTACHAALTFPFTAQAGEYQITVVEDNSAPPISHSLVFDGPDGPKTFSLPFANGLDHLVLGSLGRVAAFGSYLDAVLYVIDYHASPPFTLIAPAFFDYPQGYGPPPQIFVPTPYIQYERLFVQTVGNYQLQFPPAPSFITFTYDTGIEMGTAAIPEPGYLVPVGLALLGFARRAASQRKQPQELG